ncbi:MAG: RNA methyltransferase [Halobacteriaceae archaeon]
MTISIALVDVQTPGNVGTVARAMKNFGFSDLLLVDPPPLEPGGEAYGFAGHAREDILPTATELPFSDLVTDYHTVGFTAHVNETAAKHVRYPFDTPATLRDRLELLDADTALVFGREGTGLSNEEFERLDTVCTIPANEAYPVLNLGQAVTVTLYELRALGSATPHEEPDHDRAEEAAIEGFYTGFADLLDALDYREEKRAKTLRLVRRLVGRADPTGREITTLRGVLRQARDAATDPD